MYLWLRRNFINDIIFRQSENHLDFMVEQMKVGKTSIKSNIEVCIGNKAKLECLNEKEQEIIMLTSSRQSIDFSKIKQPDQSFTSDRRR